MSEKISSTRRKFLKAIPAIGAGVVVTTPVKAELTPDERMCAALAELESIFSEKYGVKMETYLNNGNSSNHIVVFTKT